MGGLKKSMRTLLLVALMVAGVVALVSYRVYVVLHRTMPADLAEVDKIRWLDELGRMARGGGSWMDSLGIEPGIEPLKIFINTAFSLLFNPLPWQRVVYRSVRVSQDVYDGVPVSTYTPLEHRASSKEYPTIIYFHGGGWTWLSVGVYDGPLKHFANSTKFKIIAVEYRTSPQHPFPAPYDDCLAVTKYVVKHARELNIRKDLIAVAGDGAGGNLAAAVANEMTSLVKLQLLINPALQMMNFATPSYQDYSDEHHLLPGITSADKEINNWIRYADIHPDLKPTLVKNQHVSLHHYNFFSHYIDSRKRMPADLKVTQRQTVHNSDFKPAISSKLDTFVLDSRFNPMFTPDVRNVAKTYIITSQYDVLRDEALMYGHRLKENGLHVELRHYHHGFHGFFMFAGGGWIELEESQRAMEQLAAYLDKEVSETEAH